MEMVFLGSGDTFFSNRQLQSLRSKPYDIINITIESSGYEKTEQLYTWEKPMQKQYVIGVDVATKLGDDRSTIEVIDPLTHYQV
ncbi:MAG: hypothetical protein QXV17_01425 [Candidatus Micrarchaeaceae archaeon]